MRATGPTTFDAILEEVGSYGRYQKWRIGLMVMPSCFYAALMANVLVFQTVVPAYWCQVPGREMTNYTLDQWKNLTLPPSLDKPGSLEKCSQYNVTFHEDQVAVDHTELSCQSGWQHDDSSFTHTVATYYGWFCDKESYANDIFAVNAVGNGVGTFVLPIIAERLTGRRIMFLVAISLAVVFNFLTMVTPNYFLHLTCRFFAGMSFECNWNMPYTILMELVRPEKRTTVCFLLFISWSLGMMIIPLLAWALPHWIHLTATVNVIGLYFFFFYRVLPESPRWLLSWEKYDEGAAVLQQIARSNGKVVPPAEELVEKLKYVETDEKDKVSFLQIFRYSRLSIYLFATAIQVLCFYLIYGCTLLSLDILPDRVFLSFFISSLVQAPTGFLGWAFSHYLGRRASGHILGAVLSLFCLLGAVSTDKWLLFSMAALVKCITNATIYILFLYLTEVFPTPIRASAFGCTVVVGFVGYACSPYVNAAGVSTQFWVMFAMALMSLLCSVPLPETVGLPLPQTFEEAQDICEYRPLTTWVHHWNFTKYMPAATDQDTEKETQDGGEKKPE